MPTSNPSHRTSVVCFFSCAFVLSGCAMLKSAADGIGSAGSFIGDALSGPKVEFSRPAPASKDLPNVKSVALGEFDGEGSEELSALVKMRLSESGRFKIVPRERVEELARQGQCDTSDTACIAKVQPGFSVVTGRVTTSEYDEAVDESVIDCPAGKKKTKKCVSQARTGKAHVALVLELKGPDGTLLAEHSSEKTAEKEETNFDGKADKIDSKRLLADARAQAAEDFLNQVSPRRVKESVPLESDGDIPQLEQGVKRLTEGSTSEGVRLLRMAVERADAGQDVALKGKSHYSLGVGLLAEAKFSEGVKELKNAQALTPEDDWAALITKAESWGSEAAHYDRQVALGKEQPAAPPEALASSTDVATPAKAVPATAAAAANAPPAAVVPNAETMP